MSLVIDLPKDLSLTLLRNWLSLRDIVRLDTALCSEELRQHWLQLLANEIINCSTVNLRDKDLAKLRWLMARNSFCNKIAFRACRIREYAFPLPFLIKWLQQSMHLKTLRFKEKTHITFQLLEKLLLIKFIQRRNGIQSVDLLLNDDIAPILSKPFGLTNQESQADGMEVIDLTDSKKKRVTFQPRPGLSETLTIPEPYPPIQVPNQQLPSNPPATSVNSNFQGGTVNSGNPTESSNSLTPFEVSLSPIPVIDQADSLPPRNVSLQTELMTANIAHPLTAMEVIERMIQRTLSNLKEHQRSNEQQFQQSRVSKRRINAKRKPDGRRRKKNNTNTDNSNSQSLSQLSQLHDNSNSSSAAIIKMNSYDEGEDAEVIDLTNEEEESPPIDPHYDNDGNSGSNNGQLATQTQSSANQNFLLLSNQSTLTPEPDLFNISLVPSPVPPTNITVTGEATIPPQSVPWTNTIISTTATATATATTSSSQPTQQTQESNNENNDNSSSENNSEENNELNEMMMSDPQLSSSSLSTSKQKQHPNFFLLDGALTEADKKRLLLEQFPSPIKSEHLFQNIEELYFHFHDMSLLTSYFLHTIFPQVPKLKSFTVIDCMKVTDEDINHLIRHCPLIEEITIDNCALIQGLFVPNLLQYSLQLMKIMIKHCQVINKSSTLRPPHNLTEIFKLPFQTDNGSTPTHPFNSPSPYEQYQSSIENQLIGRNGLLDHRQAVSSPAPMATFSNSNSGTSSSAKKNLNTIPFPPQYSQIKYHLKLVCCDFTHSRDIGDYLLPYLLFYCPNLERMNISFCHLSTYQFQYIYSFCQRLKVLFLPGNSIDDESMIPIVSHCEQLESMVVGFSPRVTEKTIHAIASHLRLLKTFALWGNHRALTEESMRALVKGCKQLEKVALTYTGTTDEVLEILVQHCPLTRIEINGCQLLTDRCITSIATYCADRLTHFVAENVLFSDEGCEALASCHRLEYVNLSNSKKITSQGMIKIIQQCPHIQVLKLKECQLLTDDFLVQVAESGKQLRELDISYIKSFTLETILLILEKCDHLHKIVMIACFQDHFAQQAMNKETIQDIIKTGTKKRIHIIH